MKIKHTMSALRKKITPTTHRVGAVVRQVRSRTTIPVHNALSRRVSWYERWHKHPHHRKVHTGALVVYLVVVAIASSVLVRNAQASTTYTQSTWSGGVGSNTSNQYASATNIDSSVANQLTLSKGTNLFTNTTFDSDLTSWNGYSKAFDNTQSYSASGSAKITAGGVTSTALYNHLTTSTVANQLNMTSSDINGDGLQDIIATTFVSSASTEARVYLSNSDGTYGSATVLTTPTTGSYDLVAGDFTGDGWNDVIVTEATASGSSKIALFTNNGSGTLGSASEITVSGGPTGGSRPCTIEKGFIDANSSVDFVLLCSVGTNAFVFLNNGSGTFAQSNYALGFTASAPQRSTLIDIGGDGRPELVTASASTTVCTMYIYPNNGSGFDAANTYTINQCGTSNAAKYAITGGDVNGDGKGDVAIGRRSGAGGTASSDTYYMSVFLGNASNNFASQADYAGATGSDDVTSDMAMADISGDGYLDIVQSLPTNNLVGYYKNNGDSTFASKVDYSTGTSPNGLTITDSNGDSKSDVAVVNASASNFSVFINRTPGDAMNQMVNVGDTAIYQLEAYVYTTGSAVTSTDAELWYNGAVVSTTFTASATPGWYKLTGSVTGANAKRGYGVVAKQGKTIYVDNMNLYKYASSGSLVSAIYDLGFGGDWGVLDYATSLAGSVQVKIRTSNDSGMSGAPAFSSCSAISDLADLTGASCVNDDQRYLQYEVTLNQSSGDTPVFSSISIDYDAFDNTPPITNASAITMQKTNGGASIASNAWTNGSSPYFAWAAGVDNIGGTGIAGYCVYLGADDSQNPVSSKGLLGTSPAGTDTCPFAVNTTSLDLATISGGTPLTTSNDPYYISIKAYDLVGNVYSGSSEQFQFRFDNTAPSNPAYLSAPSQFVNTKTNTITWPTVGGDAASDANSGVVGLQYRINSSTWYGDSHTGSEDSTDLLTDDGSYTTVNSPDFANISEGINTIYVRTWDEAGNYSTSYATTALKINTTGAPSTPLNVYSTPASNTTNSFAFNWSPPTTYVGDVNNITYCYSINAVPSISNCTYTPAGITALGAGPYATQPGTNTFYVVARDESSNINYATAASATFTATTTAPGIPLNLDIADVSIKATSNWRLALTWEAPIAIPGASVASYRILRSDDNGASYAVVGSSSSTTYIDSGLSQQTYYYKVKACDSVNNCGALSSNVSEYPTGKFTSPATLVSAPEVSNISTRKATISWVTDRNSDSRIAIGTKSGEYSPAELANSTQTQLHAIDLTNLAAGTTYYYVARWTDDDGNTGVSSEGSFSTSPAPVVKEVTSSRVNLSSAAISLTVKSAAQVKIYYGLSEGYGGLKTLNTSLSESSYTAELTGLNDGTKYFYKVNSLDSEGNEYEGNTYSFTTPARPRISNLTFEPISGEPTSTQLVSWKTNVPTTSQIIYNKVGATPTEIANSSLVTEHSITIRNLVDSSEYTLIAQSRDSAGNLAESDRQVFKTALDTRPPKISDIAVETTIKGTGIDARGQLVITWKTDEPSTSQIQYGEGTLQGQLSSQTAEDSNLTTEHVVIISDLSTAKAYTIRPISRDAALNTGYGEEQSSIIGRATESVFTIIVNTLQRVFGFLAK